MRLTGMSEPYWELKEDVCNALGLDAHEVPNGAVVKAVFLLGERARKAETQLAAMREIVQEQAAAATTLKSSLEVFGGYWVERSGEQPNVYALAHFVLKEMNRANREFREEVERLSRVNEKLRKRNKKLKRKIFQMLLDRDED